MNTKPNNNTIALICIVVGAAMTLVIFFESRLDPGLRMAALVFASNISTAIVAISSLLLTGKDLTGKHDPADLPPGSVQVDASTTQLAPVADPTTSVPAA